jgi:hypothetical protein
MPARLYDDMCAVPGEKAQFPAPSSGQFSVLWLHSILVEHATMSTAGKYMYESATLPAPLMGSRLKWVWGADTALLAEVVDLGR